VSARSRTARGGAPGRARLVRVAAVALTSAAIGCGGVPATEAVEPAGNRAATSAPSEAALGWAIGAFSLRLPSGVHLAMDADGFIRRDGEIVLRMLADGRVVDTSGATVAALLSDGQVSHRRELQPARIAELPSVLDGARQLVLRGHEDDLVVLERDTLRIAEHAGWPHGRCDLEASVGSRARPLVVFVTLLELLDHPSGERPSGERPSAVRPLAGHAPPRADAIAPPVDVVAPPAHATRTASGLAYVVLAPGRGTQRPGPRSRVRVHYTGWTTDGAMFDSSVARGEPATFPLNGVIPGWTEGLQLMVEGQRTRFWMPPALGYGEHPRPGVPSGMLVFDVELLEIVAP
jgi:hypothetical protein